MTHLTRRVFTTLLATMSTAIALGPQGFPVFGGIQRGGNAGIDAINLLKLTGKLMNNSINYSGFVDLLFDPADCYTSRTAYCLGHSETIVNSQHHDTYASHQAKAEDTAITREITGKIRSPAEEL